MGEKKTQKSAMRENMQLILTLASVVVGLGLGVALRAAQPEPRTIELIGFPGEILMSMLKLTILPLISASLISGERTSLTSIEMYNARLQV